MYSGMRKAFIAECFPILFHLLSGSILTLILEVMLADPMPVKYDIKRIVRGLISTLKKIDVAFLHSHALTERGSPQNVSFVILLWCLCSAYVT